MTATPVGAWDRHYAGLARPVAYGGDTTYRLAAEWTAGCATVEDWGCGGGWLRGFVAPGRYRGIDGSRSPFADEVRDLALPSPSRPDGIVIRHVLEHDHRWPAVLDNAVAAFGSRLFVAVFTPPADATAVLRTEADYGGVPVIAFAPADLLDRIAGRVELLEWETLPTATFYGAETVIRAAR